MPRVEYAASGRAKCRGCSMSIGNGTVRVGDEAEGDWGPYMRWFHLGCYGFRSGASATTIWLRPPPRVGPGGDEGGRRRAARRRRRGRRGPGRRRRQHADGRRLGAAAVDGRGRRAVDEQYREEHDAFYGECGVMIVGCQYYGGVIHRGEMANLVREPANPYDGNAVRVDNLAGDQVGHLKRVFAAALAPLVDDPSPAAVAVEAVVPQAPSSMYQVSASARFHGLPEHFAATAAHLGRFGMRLSGGLAATRAPAPSQGQRAPSNVVRSVEAAARQTQKELDAVYDSMDAALEKMDAAPFAAALQGALATELLPHQLKAVAFMAARESGHDLEDAAKALGGGDDAKTPPLPPLWETRNEKQRAVYFNSATNTSQAARPAAVRGGLLADDMGLGKTLSILALVVARDAALLAGSAPPPAPAAEWDEDAEFKRAKKLKVGELRSALEGLGRETAGLKGALVERYACRRPGAAPPAPPTKARGPTLVVAPTSVLSNWSEQAKAHAPGLKVLVYHGGDRGALDAAAYDVVVTSYGVLVAEAPDDASKKRKLSGLYTASWRRVVLDEAHTIRNPRTKTAKAVARLDRVHSWCVTGTPMVNKVEDFQAVFAFVRCAPVDDPAVFARAVARPIKEGDASGLARLRLLVTSVTLRRSKKLLASTLPPRKTVTRFVDLGGDRDAYAALFDTARCAVEGLGDDALKSYSSILECLLRLRQVCAGGASLVPAPPRRAALQSVGGGAGRSRRTPRTSSSRSSARRCGPRLAVGGVRGRGGAADAAASTSDATSTGPKIRALLEAVAAVPADEKVVVFSQFVGVLANAKAALDDAEVDARVFSGSLSAAKRAALLTDFAGDGGPRVLLVSLKCGGTGLNLTRANHVFLLDTWWNAAVEEQAMDRVHRLGQTRPVTAVRLVADKTVESRILDIQQAKTLVSAGALARLSADEVRKARLGDIKRLFEPYAPEPPKLEQ
ncbi:helicase [Aureococcus anophagefferens]|nr:helicase [Aureococcus anophagefferens]